MNLSIFKGYDIRGLYPEQVNEDLAYAVGRAVVRMLSAKTIVVGNDMRESSPKLKEKLIEGISCEGADVVDLGMCTTPMVSFALCNYDYDAGVMVSASHSPEAYNAFKIIKPGIEQVDENSGLLDLAEVIQKGFASCPGKGAVTEKEILADYLGHILKFATDISDLNVAIDYGNGVGAISGKPAYARMDIDVSELYPEPDGRFPNHPANPHDIVNFKDLKKKVLAEKCDLGIFFDGDADRALFVDEKGAVIPPDLLMALLAKDLLQKTTAENKEIYYDLRFSKTVPKIIKKAGGTPVMMAVGNPLYKKALVEKGGLLSLEFSGHIMYKENWGIDDGLLATIKVMQLMTKEKKPISTMIEEIKEYEGSDEMSMEAKNPDTLYDRLISEFADGKLLEIDGVYFDYPDGFVSVRRSRNEKELFRIRVEAGSKEELKKRLDKVLEIVKS